MAAHWRAWRRAGEPGADHPECFGKHASFDKLSTKVTAYRLITRFLALDLGCAVLHLHSTSYYATWTSERYSLIGSLSTHDFLEYPT